MKFVITHQETKIEQLQNSTVQITELVENLNVNINKLVEKFNIGEIVNHYRDKMYFD